LKLPIPPGLSRRILKLTVYWRTNFEWLLRSSGLKR
jgi:hypothetical protein